MSTQSKVSFGGTSAISGMTGPIFKAKGPQSSKGPIEVHFNNWNRFENFLKFADRKEIKEKLKDFDAPSFKDYVDPDLVEKIVGTGRPPVILNKKKPVLDAKEENRLRIEKMKELYGLKP